MACHHLSQRHSIHYYPILKMELNLKVPSWATHLFSDLDNWKRRARPVDTLKGIQLPDDVYFEYAWLHDDGTVQADPYNSNPPCNEWWPYARYLTGPDYAADPLVAMAQKHEMEGSVLRLRLESQNLQQRRHLIVYTLKGCEDKSLPHIVFQDGKAYYGWGNAARIFECLVKAGECEKAHLLFIPPMDRSIEYHFNEAYLAFVHDEVLPTVEKQRPCDGRRCAWGASMGGLCSAELAWRYPESFQTVVSQSGAFLFYPGQHIADDILDGREWWAKRVSKKNRRPLRWLLQTGTLEWLHRPNRNLAHALTKAGYPVHFQERSSGHNWTTWRNGMADAFRFALPF